MYAKLMKEMNETNNMVVASFYFKYPMVHEQILFKMVYENRFLIYKLFSMDIIDNDQAISLEKGLTLNLDEKFWVKYNAWYRQIDTALYTE